MIFVRNALIAICVAGAVALPRAGCAQSTFPEQLQALYDRTQQFSKAILDDTLQTSERANSRVAEGNFYQAAREYEALLGRHQDTPDSLLTYPVLMALGGAHLEAAINLVWVAAKDAALKDNLKLRNQNRDAINDHIGQVYTLVGTAASRAHATGINGPDAAQFVCEASAKVNAAVIVHGIVNSNGGEVDMGIAGYQKIEGCYPEAGRIIGHLKDVRRNIDKSMMGSNSIAAMVSLFVKAAVPKGSMISTFLDGGYKFYNERRPPLPNLPR